MVNASRLAQQAANYAPGIKAMTIQRRITMADQRRSRDEVSLRELKPCPAMFVLGTRKRPSRPIDVADGFETGKAVGMLDNCPPGQ